MIYIAYGANLNKSAMRHRCPDATPVGSSKVKDYKLIFNNVASIVKSPGSTLKLVCGELPKIVRNHLIVLRDFQVCTERIF